VPCRGHLHPQHATAALLVVSSLDAYWAGEPASPQRLTCPLSKGRIGAGVAQTHDVKLTFLRRSAARPGGAGGDAFCGAPSQRGLRDAARLVVYGDKLAKVAREVRSLT